MPHRQQLELAKLLPLLERTICARPRGSQIGDARPGTDGKAVLITGAGGGIGSALAHAVASARPSMLALLDNSEYGLYAVDQAIECAHPETPRTAILADVRDGNAMRRCFDRVRPDAVFHAAALKHVPMVEAHPLEGILTNVLGVRNVLDAAANSGASAFVQISTDKAARPIGVMGATKRIAERLVQAQTGPEPRAAIVRLGNVLGSPGSVVERFLDQARRGAPLTVTDPGVSRYFMTMREAAGAILAAHRQIMRAGAPVVPVHILDMGQPVRIVNLARAILDLCADARTPAPPVRFTGLRQGEKLLEDLACDGEYFVPSGVNGMLTVWTPPPPASLIDRIDELICIAQNGDAARALEGLWRCVDDPAEREHNRSRQEQPVRA